MNKKLLLWLLWVGFIVYLLLLAPPFHWEFTKSLIVKLLTLQWNAINPVIFSLFSLIGVWILIYSSLLFFDGRMQPIPFYPFAILSLGTGVIGLIPYLALREPNTEFSGTKDLWLTLLDSRATGIVLMLFTLGLLIYALLAGDWGEFWLLFQGDRFVNGMSLAFCLFCLLFPLVLGDDMTRRGYLRDSQLFWLIALVPLLGPLIYLSWRSPLRTTL
ncbi:MAG TPA: DUF2834 domain-containing protein [Coleofasciculaceae cyanobacterium]|jgi:hypothetical protein